MRLGNGPRARNGQGGVVTMGGDSKPLLIMVGSSRAHFRSYIFESISARYRLWLLSPAMPTWEIPFIESHSSVDCTDTSKLTAAAQDIASRHEVAGLFCYDETLVEHAAVASATLSLPSWDPAAVSRCRDKNATRKALAAAGLPQPRAQVAGSLAEAQEFASLTGYPVILKPRNLAGSVGVMRAEGPRQLAEAYQHTANARMPGFKRFKGHVLIEEFVAGPEIAVDSVVFEGRCQPVVVAHKILGAEPPFEFDEHGHDVRADDPLLADPRLADALSRGHAAVGFRNGVTHTELKITPDNDFCIIEINARMGGDLIPYLGYLASGYDESLAAADVAAGRRPARVLATRHKAACVRFANPRYAMRVTEARVREELITPPVHKVVVTVTPDQVLELPPKAIARLGYVIAVADTVTEARACVDDPGRYFDVSGRPLAGVAT